MGLLEGMRIEKEKKEQREAEDRQMDFSREQNREAQALAEDGQYLKDSKKFDLIRWQQDFGDDLQFVKYKLLGYTPDANGQWVKPKDKKGMCNEDFIEYELDPIAATFLNRNAFNSNLSKQEISNILTNTFLDLGRNLRFKHRQYAIEFKDFDTITRMLKNISKMAINKSAEGWLKKLDNTNLKRIEAFHDRNEEPTKKSIWGFGG